MKAVVLVGGYGTRLMPLTQRRPKPLVPIFDRPMLHHQLTWLARHGVTEVTLAAHHLHESVAEAVGDGSAWGLGLRVERETQPLGTAGALAGLRPWLGEAPFVMLNGDILTGADLGAMVLAHRQAQALATLGLVRVPDPSAFGMVELNGQGMVCRFVEKPSPAEATSDTVNAGVYVLQPQALDGLTSGQAASLEREVFPRLLRAGAALLGWGLPGGWRDVGSPGAFQALHEDVLLGRLALSLDAPRAEGGVWLSPGALLDPSAHVEGPVYLGPGAWVGPRARLGPLTVLGAGARVEERADLERCILLPGASVAKGARVAQAILGHGAAVEAEAQLLGPAVLAEGSVLGPCSRVGWR